MKISNPLGKVELRFLLSNVDQRQSQRLKPISMWYYVLFRLARNFTERSLHQHLCIFQYLKHTQTERQNVKNLLELRDSGVDVTIPREKRLHQSIDTIQAASEGLKTIINRTQGLRFTFFLQKLTQPFDFRRMIPSLKLYRCRVITALLHRNQKAKQKAIKKYI